MILQEGFRYHHAEPDYLMLVTWIAQTPDTIPANASHVVGIGALVFNNKTGEVNHILFLSFNHQGTNKIRVFHNNLSYTRSVFIFLFSMLFVYENVSLTES